MSLVQPWVQAFQQQLTLDVPWLTTVRQHALERFADAGWPTLRQEGWHHTALNPVASAATQWLQAAGLAQTHATLSVQALTQAKDMLQQIGAIGDTDHCLVFVDGVYVPQLSRSAALAAGVRLSDLRHMLHTDPQALQPYYGHAEQGTAVAALNTAFATQGVFLEIEQGIALDETVHLVFVSLSPGRVHFYRNLIALHAQASATVLEHFIGPDAALGLTHTTSQAWLARDAQLTHAKHQQEGLQYFHLGTTNIAQHSGSQLYAHSLSLGARLARHDVHTCFDGKGCHALLNGLYVVDGKRHVDHHTLINHAQPDNVSQEYYRGILADQSRGVFRGRVLVAPGADRTDAQQRCDHLLLSRTARADAQPELEIYADDVKCAHGATTGQLDEDSLFYLRARGLGHEDAHNVLVYAFAQQALIRMASPVLRVHANRALRMRFPGAARLGDFAWQ